MATSGGSAAYASDILSILSLYYQTELGAIAGITLLLTTQLIGYGFGGLLQELLVKRQYNLALGDKQTNPRRD